MKLTDILNKPVLYHSDKKMNRNSKLMSDQTDVNKMLYFTPKSPQKLKIKEILLKSSDYDNIKDMNIHVNNEVIISEEEVKFPQLSPKKYEDNVKAMFN